MFLPRRGTLIVGNVRQGALLLVVEACPIFQVHGYGGGVVERAFSGLIGAGHFDAFVGSERAGCYARDGCCGCGSCGGGGLGGYAPWVDVLGLRKAKVCGELFLHVNPADSLNPMSKSFASTEISYEPPKLGFESANTASRSVRIN